MRDEGNLDARRVEGEDEAVAEEKDRVRSDVASLLRDFSTEVFITEADERRLAGLLPSGTSVYLPHTRSSSPEQTVDAVRRLRSAGFDPVPHIAARRLTSREALASLLARLRQAGAEAALVIGGDAAEPAGDFSETMDVLRSGLFEQLGYRHLGLAGHPEGLPGVEAARLFAALREKCALAAASGLAPYVVTQFCFDADAIIGWDRAARQEGIDVPVHVGLPGATSLRKLIGYAQRCGVGDSIRFLYRNTARVAPLAAAATPEGLTVALARYRAGAPGSLIAKAHFFPFGALEETARWIAQKTRNRRGS